MGPVLRITQCARPIGSFPHGMWNPVKEKNLQIFESRIQGGYGFLSQIPKQQSKSN